MSDEVLYCIRGCARRDKHLPHCTGVVPCDDCAQTEPDPETGQPAVCQEPVTCRGCEPRQTDTGWLCRGCVRKLETLLAAPTVTQSVAWVCAWLSTNLGQHIRSSLGGKPSGDGSTTGDHMVAVMDAMADLQIGIIEIRDHFAQDRRMRPKATTAPDDVTAWLRPWLTTLAAWEPIGDAISDLLRWREQAHAVAPWRGRDPEASTEAAAQLHLAPPETTDAIRQRFGVTVDWLKKARQRHGLEPVDVTEKPYRWRPWDVYRLLHRQAADDYLAQLARQESGLVWSSEDTREAA